MSPSGANGITCAVAAFTRKNRSIPITSAARTRATTARPLYSMPCAGTGTRSKTVSPQKGCQHGRGRLRNLEATASAHDGVPAQSHTRTVRAAKRHRLHLITVLEEEDDRVRRHTNAFLKKMKPSIPIHPKNIQCHSRIGARRALVRSSRLISGAGKNKNTGAPGTNRTPDN